MVKGSFLKKSVFGLLCLALPLAAGCSGSTGTGNGGGTKVETKTDPSKPKEPVTLVLKHTTYDDFGKDLEPAIKKYQEKNPHVTVKVEMVKPKQGENIITANTALFASGEQVDILRVSPNVGAGEYAARGWIDPLDDYMKKESVDIAKYYPSLQKSGVYNNKRYALPWVHSQFVVFYNKDIFNKFGIPEPKLDWTYEDMRKIGQKLVENKVYAFESLGGLQNMLHIAGGAYGGKTFNETGTQMALDNPNAIKGYEYFRDIVMKEGFAPGPFAKTKGLEEKADFATNAAMQFTWLKMKQLDEKKINYGIVPAPVGPGKQQGYGALDGIAISSTSKQKEEAFKLIKFLAYDNEGVSAMINQKLTIPVFPKEKELIEAWEKTIGNKQNSDAILYQAEKTNSEGIGNMNNIPGTEVAFEGYVTWLFTNLFKDNFDLYTEIPNKVKQLNTQWMDLQKEAEKQMKK